jgi:hypothetical protein
MLTLRPCGDSPLNFIRLEGGVFAGNGIRQQVETGMDFIGRLSASTTRSFSDNTGIIVSGGVSCYLGGQIMFDGLDESGIPKPVPLYKMDGG